MEREKLNEILLSHRQWVKSGGEKGQRANLEGANLQGAELQYANIKGANIKDANLEGANIDYSCLPLWCGGQFKTDAKVCKQLVAHTLRILELSGEGNDDMLSSMRAYKKGWHREIEFKKENKI